MLVQQLAENLWAAEGRVRFVGLWLSARMVVVRLPDGSLIVHSPIAPDAELMSSVDEQGSVRHVIAPSKYHHLWLSDWAEQYPGARIYGVAGLPEKRPDVTFDELLGDDSPTPWKGVMDQLVFRGLPIFNEVVFFHRPSRTLIVSDLVFHLFEAQSRLAPVLLRLNGIWKRFGPSRALGMMMKRKRDAAREDIGRILQWDFERVTMAHGRVLESGGRAAIEEAFAFLR